MSTAFDIMLNTLRIAQIIYFLFGTISLLAIINNFHQPFVIYYIVIGIIGIIYQIFWLTGEKLIKKCKLLLVIFFEKTLINEN